MSLANHLRPAFPAAPGPGLPPHCSGQEPAGRGTTLILTTWSGFLLSNSVLLFFTHFVTLPYTSVRL